MAPPRANSAAGRWLTAFASTLVVFVVVDAVWLLLVALPKFQAALGDWLLPAPRTGAVALFYPLYAIGLTVLAVEPDRHGEGLARAVSRGALVGLIAYGTFDLTSLAVLVRYTWDIALLDMAWGTVVSGIAAAAGRLALERWQGGSRAGGAGS